MTLTAKLQVVTIFARLGRYLLSLDGAIRRNSRNSFGILRSEKSGQKIKLLMSYWGGNT